MLRTHEDSLPGTKSLIRQRYIILTGRDILDNLQREDKHPGPKVYPGGRFYCATLYQELTTYLIKQKCITLGRGTFYCYA